MIIFFRTVIYRIRKISKHRSPDKITDFPVRRESFKTES